MSLNNFIGLSKFLLGIPWQPPLPELTDLDPDLAQVYLNGLTLTPAQQKLMTSLLSEWVTVQTQQVDLKTAVETEILGDAVLGPLARQIILAWYTGFHPWLGVPPTPDPANYERTLVWLLAQAHPMGVPVSFGYWQYPPPGGNQ